MHDGIVYKRIVATLLFVFLVFSALSPIGASAEPEGPEGNNAQPKLDQAEAAPAESSDGNVEKTYLIGLNQNTDVQKFLLGKSISNKVIKKYRLLKLLAVTLKPREAAKLAREADVSFVEEDAAVSIASSEAILTKDPSDLSHYYDNQDMPWGVQEIDANIALKKANGSGIKIAVLDTGVASHPDLKVSKGISFVDYTASENDDNGHGTHIIGTIGAVDNNMGVVGVAPEADIYPVKVLDQDGKGSYSKVIDAIEWAVANKMNIIHMSFGGQVDSQALHNAVIEADKSGSLLVAAAGSSGSGLETKVYPAAYPEVVSVGAVDSSRSAVYKIGAGNKIELVAPGTLILSTAMQSGYGEMSGTASAASHVSGTAAALWSVNEQMTNQQVKEKLLESTTPLGDQRFFGKGLVNAACAAGFIARKGSQNAYGYETERIYDDYDLTRYKEKLDKATFKQRLLSAAHDTQYYAEHDAEYGVSAVRGEGDALRHGLWSTMIVHRLKRMLIDELGAADFDLDTMLKMAERLTTAYENGTPDNESFDRDMDLYNNARSREVAQDLYLHQPQLFGSTSNPINDFVKAVKTQIKLGKLIALDDANQLVFENNKYIDAKAYIEKVLPNAVVRVDNDGNLSVNDMQMTITGAKVFGMGLYAQPSFIDQGIAQVIKDKDSNYSEFATPLNNYTGYKASIDYAGDMDWFCIKPTVSGLYAIKTTGNFDSYGELYKGKSFLLNANDNYFDADEPGTTAAAEKDYNFCIVDYLDAGQVYYLKIGHQDKTASNISYAIKVSPQSDDCASEFKSTINARTIKPGIQLTGKIDFYGDKDCFAFTPVESRSYTVESRGSADVDGVLMDQDEIIASNNDDGDAENFKIITPVLEANKMYIISVAHHSKAASNQLYIVTVY